jgi:ribose 5-phosphate isomerase B
MMSYRVAIGADHRGYELKKFLLKKSTFGHKEVTWEDEGTHSPERTDYPIYTLKVVESVLHSKADLGIMICGSGIGVSIAANRFKGIYAGIVWNEVAARLAKEHDNVNILILPADYIDYELAESCVTAWLNSTFLEGRYKDRLTMIEEFPKN